jgi:hypothetical protein
MKLVNSLIFIPLVFITTSCFKEDEKVTPHDPGGVETEVIEMTKDYRYQVYYDLASGEAVATNLKKIWDLSFDCAPGGWKILLNTSNFMLAAKTGLTDFNTVMDTVGLTWNFDASSGNEDSLAIGKWVDFQGSDSIKIYTDEVYFINRGYDESGNLRGLRKIVFLEMTDTSFLIRYANPDGTDEQYFTVVKDPAVNYVCFSFDEGGKQLNLEPPKDSWDLLFTQYTTLLYTDEGDPYPYLLTGVLTNPHKVTVAQDTLFDFSVIDYELAGEMEYWDLLDEIGYDWKDIQGDVSSGNVTYVIMEGRNYLVQDTEGFYFKLRFISFYSDEGEKGYPTFEYQRL